MKRFHGLMMMAMLSQVVWDFGTDIFDFGCPQKERS